MCINSQVTALNAEADQLMANHPDSADVIEAKLGDLTKTWGEVKNKAADRKGKLTDSFAFQKFLSSYRLKAICNVNIMSPEKTVKFFTDID